MTLVFKETKEAKRVLRRIQIIDKGKHVGYLSPCKCTKLRWICWSAVLAKKDGKTFKWVHLEEEFPTLAFVKDYLTNNWKYINDGTLYNLTRK